MKEALYFFFFYLSSSYPPTSKLERTYETGITGTVSKTHYVLNNLMHQHPAYTSSEIRSSVSHAADHQTSIPHPASSHPASSLQELDHQKGKGRSGPSCGGTRNEQSIIHIRYSAEVEQVVCDESTGTQCSHACKRNVLTSE